MTLEIDISCWQESDLLEDSLSDNDEDEEEDGDYTEDPTEDEVDKIEVLQHTEEAEHKPITKAAVEKIEDVSSESEEESDEEVEGEKNTEVFIDKPDTLMD